MDGDFMQENSTNNTSQVASSEYIITLKFLVSIFCILSIAGSLLIIIAYIAFKETRTLARQLLVNLAVADFVTALANLVGLLTNFERFHLRDENYDHDQSKWISIYCTVQAFFAQFGTDSSILWTIVVTVYLLSAIVLKKHNITSKLLPFYYIISWGIPLVIMIWFAVVGFLGFEPNTTPGWCAIKSEPSYAVAVGYTAFVYIAFVILPIISVVIISYTRITVSQKPDRCMIKHLLIGINYLFSFQQRRAGYDPQVQSITRSIDLKLILIPLIFVGLRIWGVVVDLFTFQIGDAALKENFVHSIAGLILIVLKVQCSVIVD